MVSANSTFESSDAASNSKTEPEWGKEVTMLNNKLAAATKRAQERWQKWQASEHALRRSEQACRALKEQYENKLHEEVIVYNRYGRDIADLNQKLQLALNGKDGTDREECAAQIAEERRRCNEALTTAQTKFEMHNREHQKLEAIMAELRKELAEQKTALTAAKESEQSAKDEATALRAETERHRVESKKKDQEIDYLKKEIQKWSDEVKMTVQKNQQLQTMLSMEGARSRAGSYQSGSSAEAGVVRPQPVPSGFNFTNAKSSLQMQSDKLHPTFARNSSQVREPTPSSVSGSMLASPSQKINSMNTTVPETSSKNCRLLVMSETNSPQKPNPFSQYNQSRFANEPSFEVFAGLGGRGMEPLQTPAEQLVQSPVSRAVGQRSSSMPTGFSPQPVSARRRESSVLSNQSQQFESPRNGLLYKHSTADYVSGNSSTGSQGPVASSSIHQMGSNTLPSTRTTQVPQKSLPPQHFGCLTSNSSAKNNSMQNSFYGESNQHLKTAKLANTTKTASLPMQNAPLNQTASSVLKLGTTPNTLMSNAPAIVPPAQFQHTGGYKSPMRNEQSSSLQTPQGSSRSADTLANWKEMILERIPFGVYRNYAQTLFASIPPQDGVNHSQKECLQVFKMVQLRSKELKELQMKSGQEKQHSAGQQASAAQMGIQKPPQQTEPSANKGHSTATYQAPDASNNMQVQLQEYLNGPALHDTAQAMPQPTMKPQAPAQQPQPGRFAPPQPPGQYNGVACIECHRSWNNQWCDNNEPCENCQSAFVDCVRLPCEHASIPKSQCPKGTRCSRAHNDDGWTLAAFKKDLKRKGKSTDDREAPAKKRRVEGEGA